MPNASGLFSVEIKGEPWTTFRPAEKKNESQVSAWAGSPTSPDADNYLAPFLDKDNTLGSPYVNSTIRSTLIPESRREADRLAAVEGLTEIQDKVANNIRSCRCGRASSTSPRDDITGTEWALNSSSTLQLWELGRGVGG